MKLEFALSSDRPVRAERGPSGPLFFALTLFVSAAFVSSAEEPILKWIHSPEACFATSEEQKLWTAVVTPADAQKFIDAYWARRGPQFKKDVRSRIEFADANFALAKVPGSRTAAGQIWMLMGAPNEQKTIRAGQTGAGMEGFSGRAQDNTVERGAKVTYRWVYKKDRLRPELGVSELIVDFTTDISRSTQYVENPGIVVPYLRRVAEAITAEYAPAIQRPPALEELTPLDSADPLWNANTNLNGTLYTSESYVGPTGNPFYAVSFFLPKGLPIQADWNSGLFVALVRDPATGQEVLSSRQPVEFQPYDAVGNFYVDRGFALDPGHYEGLFAIYTPEGTTLLASHREEFDVAASDVSRASKLLLTSHIDTLADQAPEDPFTFVAQKYAVRTDRRFVSTDKLGLFTVVANPTGSPSPRLTQRMVLTRDGKMFARTPIEPAVLTQTGPNTFLIAIAFDPGTFKPGHYTIELSVRDMNAPEESDLRTKGYVLNTDFDVVE